MTGFDEKSLINGLVTGEYRGFTQLYDMYWEPLYCYIQRIVNDESQAKDIVQDTFLKLWQLRENLGHVQSIKAYATTMASRLALRYLRQHKKTELLESFAAYLSSPEPSALDRMIKNELSLIVDKQVEKLPGRMKETFLKSRNEGLSNREIAALMEVSEQTVKKQIAYSLRHLRIALSRHHTWALLSLIFF